MLVYRNRKINAMKKRSSFTYYQENRSGTLRASNRKESWR